MMVRGMDHGEARRFFAAFSLWRIYSGCSRWLLLCFQDSGSVMEQ